MTASRGWRVMVAVLVALALFAILNHNDFSRAQDTAHFITLNYWPVDAPHWYVLDYPDTDWTWAFLGLNSGKPCPPYRIHDRAKSAAYWRDPSLPEDQDWNQASHGNGWVSCYRGHAGTDIAVPPFSPVYAVADGEVLYVNSGKDGFGPNGVVAIQHHREIAGYTGDWIGRYVHLENNFPITRGHVREGQLIGYVANRGRQTHLHYEMDDLWDCHRPCIVNPWGPTFLFFDDDYDRRPDPASAVLAAAPAGEELLVNGDFAQGWSGWAALSGVGEAIQDNTLILGHRSDHDSAAGVQQIIPYSLPADTTFEISVSVRNAGSSPSSVWVSLRDIRTFDRSAGCATSLAPDPDGVTVTMRGRTTAQWSNLVLLISTSQVSGGPIVIKSVSLKSPSQNEPPTCQTK